MVAEFATFAALAWKDLIACRPQRVRPEAHLLAAEAWLRRAHDAGGDGGVSYGYSLRGGWRPSYPETTGYILCTFLDLARRRQDPDYLERAQRMARWLLSVQNRDGSFANPRYGPEGIVFDTGQDLFGLTGAYETFRDQAFLDAAVSAAGWLVRVTDRNLRWTRNEHLGTAHVYNTRTAWALLELNRNLQDPALERVARSNLDWALEEQQESGFFSHCAFKKGETPYTHTIAYAVRGLLESGLLLGEGDYVDAAARGLDATLAHLREDGFLPGRITPEGRAAARYGCLTGNCQFAINCLRLCGRLDGYRRSAQRLLDYVMEHHDIHAANPGVRGGVKGSQPVWGGYAPLTYPNWAAKFFVDAMWLERETMS